MTREVDRAVKIVQKGGVVVYPTDTLWGLGARVEDPAAVERVFQIKNRPRSEPLTIAVGTAEDIDRYAVVTPTARRILTLLPGAVTLVLARRTTVPDVVTAGGPTVGVRVPDNEVALELLRKAGALTATSANLHGQPAPVSLDDVKGQLGDRVDYYLSTSSPREGRASTLVDARGAFPKILRTGVISERRIRECLS